MTVCFEVPEPVGLRLRAGGIDADAAAREAFLVDLYRKGQLTRYELSQALGQGRYETDGVLKRHDVPIDLTVEELRSEVAALEALDRA